ncbi:superoxide dismutase [Hujiaoplasma nucleasis]|uniref:Superoxide dismutase n=1 Tax=Hujiaoplasma nucleasis TaxID=2725268 RepID=A0A7L6N644_9MOLU|nr:superoxide dismutase [Hujiaoplasma nucleasis]QLY39954.1 superoxide dismutase [Hujiaoplasma nucleasis]
MKHILPELTYNYKDLEPYIDALTMEIHYSKHHQGYITKYVNALEGHNDLLDKDVEEVLKNLDLVPEGKKQAVINNGGGYYNHRLFWTILSPKESKMSSDLEKAINNQFGSFDQFKEEFMQAANTRFGSGWAWLVVTNDKKLKVVSTANQDTPFDMGQPILALDVWEHAYYLNYQNKRPEYVENFFKVINWEQVSKYYQALV